jgi:DNA polymerase
MESTDMVYAFDFEVFKFDWLVVIKNDQSTLIFHNDQEGLRNWLKETNPVLIGFNNHHYDDVILYNLLSRNYCTPADLLSISKKIIEEDDRKWVDLPVLTLDTRQELDVNLSLKAIEAHLGWDIVECSVPWDIDRPLTEKEIAEVTKYCIHDVDATIQLWKLRKDYFDGKWNLIKEFGLDAGDWRKTQASLSATVLGAKSNYNPPKDRLCLDYDPNINWKLIPPKVKSFYDGIEKEYLAGAKPESLEKNSKIFALIGGITNKLGVGGIHGAIQYYKGEGNYLHIDVGSYYPALMINNKWLSRACKNPEKFNKIRDTRFALKKAGDPRQEIYKIILNSTFGATKAKYNKMFDPKMANNICVNGQLIMIQLIRELEQYCKLIQSNTDGLIVEVKNLEGINQVLEDFSKKFNLTFSKTRIKKIIQRDVNNYAVQYANGKIKTKGIFSIKDWRNNSLNVMGKALQNYFFKGGNVLDTVLSGNILDFQIIGKCGRSYKYMETNGEVLQRVNRIFATKTGSIVYKVKENGQRDKVASTSERSTVWNVSNCDNIQLDRQFYYQIIQDEISKFR